MANTSNSGLIGKYMIRGELSLVTGLHISNGDETTGIGAVDRWIVRDPLRQEPYIPGSSLKGKLRFCLARFLAGEAPMIKLEQEGEILSRLFGQGGREMRRSRLQFFDLFMTKASAAQIADLSTDLYLSEIKFENVIDRLTATALPRQFERAIAGSRFAFNLCYNAEDQTELGEDLLHLGTALSLLEDDYLGGHGSRGYGRVHIELSAEASEFRTYGREGAADYADLAWKALQQGRQVAL